jgi:hypothetical protein
MGQRLIAYPFKLNPIWLEEEGFSEMVSSVWRERVRFRTLCNEKTSWKIKSLKTKVIGWEKLKKKQRYIELDTIEEELENLYTLNLSGRATMDTDRNIKELEGRRLKYLLDEEETWRQKSRAIWLQ